jgi:hypothetical protein
MNTPPSRGRSARALAGMDRPPLPEKGELIGNKIRWDEFPGANPRENYYGNPFLQNKESNITKDRALKAGKK